MKQFSFTDGSYFLIPMEEDGTQVPSGNYRESFEAGTMFIYRNGDNKTPNFSRTDLDGHSWVWSGETLYMPAINYGNYFNLSIPDKCFFWTWSYYGYNMWTDRDETNYMFPIGDVSTVGIQRFYYYLGDNGSQFIGIDGVSWLADGTNEMSRDTFLNRVEGEYRFINFDSHTGRIECEGYFEGEHYHRVLVSNFNNSPEASMTNNFHNSLSNYITDNDPYSDGGQSDSYGGNGVFDNSTTNIDFPTLPSISASDAGFITLFNPTLAQMKSLQNYLWGDLFDIDTFKKVLSNPMDVIMGLSIVPFDVPSGGAREIMIGNLGSGVTANVATSQFLSFDMGTLTIQSGVGDSYLDYSPYTKASIFLPYIGWQDLDIDEIMNKTLSLKYYCDILSGGCVAMLKCGGSVLYTFAGQCSLNIPLTSIDYTSTISSALSAVQHVAGAIGGFMGAGGSAVGKGLGIAGSVVNGVAGLASDVMNAKPQYQRSGSVGGASGLLSPQTPYIELTRPSIQRPKFQDTFVGYPSYVYKKVSQLVDTGFNAFSEIILENIGLTADEMQELEEIMKGGVVL